MDLCCTRSDLDNVKFLIQIVVRESSPEINHHGPVIILPLTAATDFGKYRDKAFPASMAPPSVWGPAIRAVLSEEELKGAELLSIDRNHRNDVTEHQK
jgi:hypothetical protein